MARRVFFSFEYSHDVSRANVVRKGWVTQGRQAAGFVDAAAFEKAKNNRASIEKWIREQLRGTSVTVVLVGSHTCGSYYVKYEIEQSKLRRNGLLGIDISKIANLKGETSHCCDCLPTGYSFYRWNRDKGYKNMGDWIEEAARKAGR